MRNLLFLISFCCVSLIAQDEYAKDERGLDELRKMKDYVSSPINSGFLFINGKYIDAPYFIKVKKITKLVHKGRDAYLGGGILSINGEVIQNSTIIKAKLFKGDKYPEVSSGINKNTPLYDMKVKTYMAKVIRYIDYHSLYQDER